MSDEVFRTVAGRGRANFGVRGSEFVGHVAPARSIEAAEAVLAEVRDDHPDATHVVPAYRVRADPLRAYSSDDGEPSGTAGNPTLNVLEGNELENVVAVVVRYFGGTKLGVGGLVRAYGRAVKLAVADAGTEMREPRERFSVTVDYDDSGTVRGILESAGAEFEADYTERVAYTVAVAQPDAASVRDRLMSATGGRAAIDDV